MNCLVNYNKDDECESDLAKQKQQMPKTGTKTVIK
jgi:hypothetical protein